MDEHNDYSEYINQLPDTDTGTITNNHNNIDRADAVGVAVADRLGPLLGAAVQGITDRLDVLNKIAARLLLQAQQPTGTARYDRCWRTHARQYRERYRRSRCRYCYAVPTGRTGTGPRPYPVRAARLPPVYYNQVYLIVILELPVAPA